MQFYSAKIRLSGSLNNEVRREDLTAAEIGVLRQIHGETAVTEVKATEGSSDRSDAGERTRLVGIYGEKTVKEVLGTSVHALPKELPDVAAPAKVRKMRASAEPRDPGVPPAPTADAAADLMG